MYADDKILVLDTILYYICVLFPYICIHVTSYVKNLMFSPKLARGQLIWIQSICGNMLPGYNPGSLAKLYIWQCVLKCHETKVEECHKNQENMKLIFVASLWFLFTNYIHCMHWHLLEIHWASPNWWTKSQAYRWFWRELLQ